MRNDGFAISVVIPAYNESERIGAAIESALRQTEPAAEILVVDDGSADETSAIAAGMGARVVVQPNAGIAATRNRLLREARFPWIAFLDADDVWYPEKLAAVRAAHEARPDVDFIMSDLHCIREDGSRVGQSTFTDVARYRAIPKTRVAVDVDLLDRRDLGWALAIGNFIGTSTVAVNRLRIIERELFFDEELPADPTVFVAEDVEWYLRVLRETDALAVARPLAEYRLRPSSLSSHYGRVRYGDAKLGERVAAYPEQYVDGVSAAFRLARRGQLRHAARLFARRRDFARAREILIESQRDGARPLDAVAIALLGLAGRLS